MGLHRQPQRLGALARVGIVVDDWKLPVFEEHLTKANYNFTRRGKLTPETTVLRVLTTDVTALHKVLAKATTEAESKKASLQGKTSG